MKTKVPEELLTVVQTDDEADTSGNRDSSAYEDQRPPNMETNYPVDSSDGTDTTEEGPGQEYTMMGGANNVDVSSGPLLGIPQTGRAINVSRDRMGGTYCEAEHGQFESEF